MNARVSLIYPLEITLQTSDNYFSFCVFVCLEGAVIVVVGVGVVASFFLGNFQSGAAFKSQLSDEVKFQLSVIDPNILTLLHSFCQFTFIYDVCRRSVCFNFNAKWHLSLLSFSYTIRPSFAVFSCHRNWIFPVMARKSHVNNKNWFFFTEPMNEMSENYSWNWRNN